MSSPLKSAAERGHKLFYEDILATIYTNPYLKRLFVEGHYAKYRPHEYQLHLDQAAKALSLSDKDLTQRQKNIIAFTNLQAL